MHLKIGTRTSKLALAQTEEVISEIKKIQPDFSYEIVKINTKGDQIHHKPLRDIFEGGKNAFTSELQKALIENKIDIAIHSMKDVAGNVKEQNLCFPAYLKRASAVDVIISRNFIDDIKFLPKDFIIGSVSLRRKLAIKKINPLVKVRNLRGSVQTRIAKLRHNFKWEGHPPIFYDAIIMAKAAIERSGEDLDLSGLYVKEISVQDMIPAACQGIIGVECRKNDKNIILLLKKISHQETEICANIEREILYKLQGNCHTAVGVYCYKESEKHIVICEIASESGKEIIKISISEENISANNYKELVALACNKIRSEAKKFDNDYQRIFNIGF
ncbi:MAG: hydroxymethylbilane synthase [Rickettsiales bacterium]|nr:hydroxymethylbilane synthase [Rickettsiales bacterium]